MQKKNYRKRAQTSTNSSTVRGRFAILDPADFDRIRTYSSLESMMGDYKYQRRVSRCSVLAAEELGSGDYMLYPVSG
jgi:hypothetical protein